MQVVRNWSLLSCLHKDNLPTLGFHLHDPMSMNGPGHLNHGFQLSKNFSSSYERRSYRAIRLFEGNLDSIFQYKKTIKNLCGVLTKEQTSGSVDVFLSCGG